jgi:hypothetical protein
MKIRVSLHLAALIAAIGPYSPVQAQSATFDEQEVDQAAVIAVARPFSDTKFDLFIVEQIPGKKQCWSESGSAPSIVEPLLLNFDFTGNCRRATDSNGYSIRLDDRDLGLEYILRLVERNGELLLVGTPRTPKMPEIVVGRTRGVQRTFMKIVLDPGWKFTKRSHQGKTVGHFYFSGDRAAIAAASGQIPPVPPSDYTVASFKDISNDIYKAEIEKAVALGFVAGFKEDNTFRPENPVTREQLVSMAIDAMNTVVKIDLNATASSPSPFTDVADDRWSGKKIKWAAQNKIVAGKAEGQFKPTDPITRAELMVILRKVSEYLNTQTKQSATLVATKPTIAFSDISGHWASDTITQMSSFCNVASPLNEKGDIFAPNQPAYRNFAAAAIVRTLSCVKGGTPTTAPSSSTTQPTQ